MIGTTLIVNQPLPDYGGAKCLYWAMKDGIYRSRNARIWWEE